MSPRIPFIRLTVTTTHTSTTLITHPPNTTNTQQTNHHYTTHYRAPQQMTTHPPTVPHPLHFIHTDTHHPHSRNYEHKRSESYHTTSTHSTRQQRQNSAPPSTHTAYFNPQSSAFKRQTKIGPYTTKQRHLYELLSTDAGLERKS